MDNKEKNTKKTDNTPNTNNSKTIIIILSSVIAVCLIVIIVLLCLLLKKSDDNKSSYNKSAVSDTSMQSETSASTENSSLTVGSPDDSREAIEISTKYGTLLYPLEWEKNLRTEIVDKDEYKVEFYGTVEGKKEQHLFDLFYNGEKGYNLGTLTTETGEAVQINIESYDFELDDSWTEDEKFTLYAMQEDINYTIGMLLENGNFTIAD
ncbi:MAG: hypothetical protein IKL09_06910 [Clostridia bacterium]|nr:hypothetical protein [Clostridia bacterium]